MAEIFGQDIKLGDDGQAVIAANGELVLTDGVETGLQDIRLAMMTPIGTLFYDETFGGRVYEWVKEENTEASRNGFAAEIRRILRSDPRVVIGSEACRIRSWSKDGIEAEASWQWIGISHKNNMVIGIDPATMMVVVSDDNAISTNL